ncbi:MAG: hypothetical protein OIF48_18720 [Silicimonas sp.]|nr:hypothetical protein [Silicimonas sp.]
MKKQITLAAYLAGVTTIAVSLPAMAEDKVAPTVKAPVESSKSLISEKNS